MGIAVVFLPGVMGSTLFDNGNKVWPSYNLILRGTNSRFAANFMNPSFPFDAKGLIEDKEMAIVLGIPSINGYTKTRKFFNDNGFAILEKKTGWVIQPGSPTDKLFFEYPYDWRLDLRNSADLLHTFIQDTVLGFGANTEIYLVAHSMGGLLSRTYLKRHGVLPNIKKQILIGTPNHGSPKAYVALRDGRGLLSTAPILRNYPKNLNVLIHNLPGIYQLLSDERYGQYFGDYEPLVYVGSKPENSIRGTYIAGDPTSTIYPSLPEKALKHYALNNNTLVEDALKFHKDELGRNSFLAGKTYVIYSTELKTINGLNYGPKPGRKGSFRWLHNGDETVTERSVYDLEGLVDTANMKPNPLFTRRFSELSHTEIQWKQIVLRCVLELIQ